MNRLKLSGRRAFALFSVGNAASFRAMRDNIDFNQLN